MTLSKDCIERKTKEEKKGGEEEENMKEGTEGRKETNYNKTDEES